MSNFKETIMIKKISAWLVLGLLTVSCGSVKVTVNNETIELEEGIYAKLTTSKGDILMDFHEDLAPMTSANFIALAEGNHPKVKAKYANKPYYDGIIFHRVIPNFMIQCGDKTGTGSGTPGYQFPQEISPELRHDKAGVVSMANAGPGTNGSQFFITHNPTPHLDGGYNVFAQVISGQEIAVQIGNVERGRADRPNEDVVLEKVEIIRVGKEAKAFDAPSVFEAGVAGEQERKEAAAAAIEAEIDEMYPEAQRLESGLRYIIEDMGSGEKPAMGQVVRVNYAGYLMDGKCFDTSVEELAKENGVYDERRTYEPIAVEIGPRGRVIKGWQEGLTLLNLGGKAKLIIPPYLGYGERGAGGVIPPNASLVFDLEIVELAE